MAFVYILICGVGPDMKFDMLPSLGMQGLYLPSASNTFISLYSSTKVWL